MSIILVALGATAIYEGCVQINERMERWRMYRLAEQYARARNLPLIVVGCPKWYLFSHGTGDVVVDIKHNPLWCRCPNPAVMDIRYADRYLKPKSCVVFSSHVLEHLDADEAHRAVDSMRKVAVAQYHCFPDKWSMFGQLAPEHKSWPKTQNGELVFEQRYRG